MRKGSSESGQGKAARLPGEGIVGKKEPHRERAPESFALESLAEYESLCECKKNTQGKTHREEKRK